MTNITPKLLTLLIAAGWKAEIVSTFSAELAANILTQYFTFTAIKTVGFQALNNPETYTGPLIKNAISTAGFVSGAAGVATIPTQTTRIAMVATLHAASALLIQNGDIQSNFAMAALMAAFQDLMNSSDNMLFIKTYRKGQGKLMLVMALASGAIFATIYLTNQYFKLLKYSYKFGVQKIRFKRNRSKVQFIPLH